MTPQRVRDRIWDRIDVGDPSECWIWRLSCMPNGYGQVSWWADGRSHGTTAHRVAWEAAHGSIPEGMTVDHLCRNRPCCNPGHLRLLTNVDNATDNGMKTRKHCPEGHPYDELNTYVDPKGYRRCRVCRRSNLRARRKAA